MTCACGTKAVIKSTLECNRCYRKRNRHGLPAPLVATATAPPTTPCSYSVAHQRVAMYRGSASTHTCTCGVPAEQWAYKNHSEYEQTATVTKRYSGGKTHVVQLRWSRHVKDYDALCIRCHVERDSKPFFTEARKVPGVPSQFLSPETAQEAL
jgi:hypothetical protein